MSLYLRYAAKSDVGIVRRANEDSGFAGGSLLAVADGMGGHAAGELASSTAIATLAELDSQDLPTQDLLTALDDSIVSAAERIGRFIEADPARAGMGTTLTAILWQAGRIALIHVGDSRAYLFRDGELSQITHDHTYVQSLIDAGRITAEEARRHPKRNLLLRAIDGSQVPEGETSVRAAQVGDRYLLCSDGLSGVVEDSAIAAVLREVPDPTAAVSALVDLALEAGAPDNVTAVLADVVEVEDTDLAQEARQATPVVVGAAGEQRNRDALPGLSFPDDVGPAAEEAADPTVATGTSAGAPGGDEPLGMGGSGAGTASEAADRPESAAEPAPPAGFVRRHAGWVIGAAVSLAAVVIGVAGFTWWLSSQWYVGVQDGYVAVYQGVPQTLAGVPMSRATTRTALAVSSLPAYDQTQLARTIEATTEADAARIVDDLANKAEACAASPAPAGCPPGSTPSTPSASPSVSASPSAAQ